MNRYSRIFATVMVLALGVAFAQPADAKGPPGGSPPGLKMKVIVEGPTTGGPPGMYIAPGLMYPAPGCAVSSQRPQYPAKCYPS